MKNRIHVFLAVLVALSLSLAACGGGQVAESRLERLSAPEVPQAELTQLVTGNNAFAFDLYQEAAAMDGNHVFSPYSISLAFAMAYGGARSDTAGQMAEVLHYDLPDASLHPAFNALDQDLAGRPEELTTVDEDERFELTIANAMWGQEGWGFLPEYLDLLAANYGAGMRLVDFENNPEAARRMINEWVSQQTRKRIQDIIPPGLPDPATRLALANAIYFKATWLHKFDADNTDPEPFTLLSGDQVMVDMMEQDNGESFAYASGDGWQAIAIPYKGRLTEMVIIMPDEGNFEAFEAGLTAETYAAILAQMEPTMVGLSMPKFTFETTYALTDMLAEMGMVDAFSPGGADFSGIDGTQMLYISDAIHKAFIAVDEKGTEAAAATVIIMALSAMPGADFDLTIDHPFFYVIRDVPTGTILFMGRVLDPR